MLNRPFSSIRLGFTCLSISAAMYIGLRDYRAGNNTFLSNWLRITEAYATKSPTDTPDMSYFQKVMDSERHKYLLLHQPLSPKLAIEFSQRTQEK